MELSYYMNTTSTAVTQPQWSSSIKKPFVSIPSLPAFALGRHDFIFKLKEEKNAAQLIMLETEVGACTGLLHKNFCLVKFEIITRVLSFSLFYKYDTMKRIYCKRISYLLLQET